MLRITEIFHSIQGESTFAGLPCVLVRLTGCNLRCAWCDTAYAFEGGRRMSVPEVLEEVARHGCDLVEITGGEPLLQPESLDLMARLVERGHRVLLETSGAEPIDRVPEGIVRIVDVKCPGSGEAARNRWENIPLLRREDQVKFVLLDREDFRWAAEKVEEHGLADRCTVLFSPVRGVLEAAELAAWILEEGLRVRLQVQLHRILWPEADRGV
jgi:7-carboxy-7-deazaguanine synthase